MTAAGFADPVLDAQSTFRALMDATARPGAILAVAGPVAAPAALGRALAAVALTLLDHETPVHLDAAVAADEEARAFLSFHTSAPVTPVLREAAFAIVSDGGELPELTDCALGSDAYPDRSTTLFVRVSALGRGSTFRLEGPGIDGAAEVAIEGLPKNMATRWAANGALFPRGVDLILCGADAVMSLPRATRLKAA